jgi:hypothetical protein
MRTIRIEIKEIQVFNNSSDKKWDNDFKVYLNSDKVKIGIITARVKSVKKKNFKMLPSSAIRIKNKIKKKFKKEMAAPKISRFNKYI